MMTLDKKLIPTLRFPQFSGEWEVKRLGDVCERPQYGLNAEAVPYDGIHKYIRITDIDERGRFFDESKVTSPASFTDDFLLKDNDLLFARTGASVGKSYLYNSRDGILYFAGFLIRFSINTDLVEPKFLFNLTRLSSYDKWVKVYSARSGQPGINANEYSVLPINLPSLPEQEKIASFLSSIDRKVELLKAKKEQLEQYKKGMMQQLFAQTIRFKDQNGNQLPEWQEKRLGEIAEINPKSDTLPNEFTYIDLESVQKGKLVKNNRISIKDAPSRAARLLTKGDVLFQTVRPYQRNNFIYNLSAKDYVASTGYALLRCYEITTFIYQVIHTDEFVSKVEKLCTGTSYPAINSTDLSKIKINLPSLPEQQKIADFLSAIDRKIEGVGQQMAQTELFKKAMLQQLFV